MGELLTSLRERLRAPEAPVEPPRWSLVELAGRLVELSSHGASATHTFALSLMLDAQRRGEPAAWIGPASRCFFPPDAHELGLDLDALAVIRLADPAMVPRAADPLLRSGAFGLAVLDLGTSDVPAPLQSRLLGLAHQHQAAVLFLTSKPPSAPSLGSLVSLRAEVSREDAGPGRYRCALKVLKDKRRAPGWTHEEIFRGPPGVR